MLKTLLVSNQTLSKFGTPKNLLFKLESKNFNIEMIKSLKDIFITVTKLIFGKVKIVATIS